MEPTLKLLDEFNDILHGNNDRIVVVLGDEGVGKSTLIMQLGWFWTRKVDELGEPDVDQVMEYIAWDKRDLKEQLSNGVQYEPVVVHDAARVMQKKKAMHSEQVELEEDLFDVRAERKFVILGYQDWGSVPTVLQERRAENVFRVTSRGKFEVYGRSHMDRKVKTGNWPSTSFVDGFPSLEGTELWRRFQDEDRERKQDRIQPDEEDEAEMMDPKELADQMIEEGSLARVVTLHGNTGEPMVDRDLIELEYGISGRKAKKVKKVIENVRDVKIPEPA